MRPYRSGDQRRPAPHHRPHSHASGRVASPEEKLFLAGTAVNPFKRIALEKGSDDITVRALDLISPIGMGQRGLIVAPPGAGKTTILKKITHAVMKGYPEMKVYCLLIDERPEEVTDFRRSVQAQVFSSSLDESHENHVAVADKVMAEAFKDAAAGKDVLILIDSLTRLARVHNSQRRSGGGRTLSGGVDAGALEAPRRIFGAARCVEGLGSITILATILVDTGSQMDSVIFEEFKGTGNMEVVLTRDLASRRIFPAIDPSKSNTRRAELLFDADDYARLDSLRRGMAMADAGSAMTKLLELLEKHPTNDELLRSFKSRK